MNKSWTVNNLSHELLHASCSITLSAGTFISLTECPVHCQCNGIPQCSVHFFPPHCCIFSGATVLSLQNATYKSVLSERKKEYMNVDVSLPSRAAPRARKCLKLNIFILPFCKTHIRTLGEDIEMYLCRLKIHSWWFWFNLCWKPLF